MSRPHSIQLIGAACGLGAPDHRCAEGPERIRWRLAARGKLHGNLVWRETVHAYAGTSRRFQHSELLAFDRQLARVVHDTVAEASRFIVLGGDHSCALGTWQGATRALAARGPLGLIWIDAHMDAHTPLTSPSGNRHGMPLAALLGTGATAVFSVAENAPPLFAPEHVCLIGVRSFEPEEERLLKKLGVRVYRMHEVEKRGLAVVMTEALQRVQAGTAGFGLTVDLDAVDPREAPAVTMPVAHGLHAAELIEAVASAARQRNLVGVEIAEYNPHNDHESRTAELMQTLIETVVAAEFVLDHSVELEERYCAHNYASLPVVLTRGRGVYVWDTAGKRYIDMMSAYSAVSLGHAHPQLVNALTEQAGRLSLVSRAYFTDRLGPLAQRLCELTGFARMLPMNTGAEAVETALKAARKWAYTIKRVPEGRAQIISCAGNFHGRTIAIVGMSSDAQYRDGFGPFPPGFVQIPYGDSAALERAITPHTAAFLVEPIQGESGIVIPPAGYLAECARICREHNVLLLCDEVQTGLGRTGKWLACQHDNVQPDGVMVGKALSGGLVPISAFLASEDVMRVFTPGDHGSTFGGNPLACAVALETLNILQHEHLIERAAEHGAYLLQNLLQKLEERKYPFVREIRGKGLFIGIEFDTQLVDTRVVCEVLLRHGVLTKDTHETVLRFAPPLTITRAQLDEGIALIAHAFDEIESHRPRALRVS